MFGHARTNLGRAAGRDLDVMFQVYHPLARELFNAAFVSCYQELLDPYRESLMRSLETAFSPQRAPNIPPEVRERVLC